METLTFQEIEPLSGDTKLYLTRTKGILVQGEWAVQSDDSLEPFDFNKLLPPKELKKDFEEVQTEVFKETSKPRWYLGPLAVLTGGVFMGVLLTNKAMESMNISLNSSNPVEGLIGVTTFSCLLINSVLCLWMVNKFIGRY